MPRAIALSKLIDEHSLDENAAENLLRYLEEQKLATGAVPSDQDIVIEIVRDELGDRRICVLTPFGNRVHAPWCMAVDAKVRAERGWEVESLWSDDGFVIRLPGNEEPIETSLLLPTAPELKDLVLRELGATSLFAAKFREASARALLLPKRRAGQRAPLWQTRKRAADLLAVASRYSSFPILLESYRECVRDTFDLANTGAILAKIGRGEIRVTTLNRQNHLPSRRRCCFPMLLTTSTTATPLSPRGVPRRFRSINPSWRNCSVIRTSGNCSIQLQLMKWNPVCRCLIPSITRNMKMVSTTCYFDWATLRSLRSPLERQKSMFIRRCQIFPDRVVCYE